MNFQPSDSSRLAATGAHAEFQLSLSRLSEAVAQIVKLLNRALDKLESRELGFHLAQLLMRIREHRGHAAAWATREPTMKALEKYIAALSQMRAHAGQWLTIHAAKPQIIVVELQDFESQCWSTLGMGVVLLDTDNEQRSGELAMPSRFMHWWQELSSRPAFLMGQNTGFSSGFQ